MFLHTVCCRGVEYNGQTPATANKRGFSCYFVLNIVKTQRVYQKHVCLKTVFIRALCLLLFYLHFSALLFTL